MHSGLRIAIAFTGLVLGFAAVQYLRSKPGTDGNGGVVIISGPSVQQQSTEAPKIAEGLYAPIDRVEAGGWRTLGERFVAEPRNIEWARKTESRISQQLAQESRFREVEVACKSTICQTQGVMEIADHSQVEELLAKIRFAANFGNPASALPEAADNTVYSVAGTNPLRIKFTNFSRW